MSKKNKENIENTPNYLVEYLRQVYMVDQAVGIELFNLNQKLLETDNEKDSNKS